MAVHTVTGGMPAVRALVALEPLAQSLAAVHSVGYVVGLITAEANGVDEQVRFDATKHHDRRCMNPKHTVTPVNDVHGLCLMGPPNEVHSKHAHLLCS